MHRYSEQEKIELEHEAAKLILKCYEKAYGTPMRHIWHNEPRKPDVSCYQGDQKLDIEVAHLYASETEAMAVLGRPLSLSMQRELAVMSQAPSEQQLKVALGRLLNQKAKKSYQLERTWLLIRNASPIWHYDDFKNVQAQLSFPDTHPFEQIWLLCDFHHGDLLQLA
ncbi:hypothetical protein CWB72_13025 [Pseudoalteromonas phenolica]|uniref:hypothetical protein n=1 Tax=Pseudoalteromonas phenolica TaxID=161398 RepID=UPI00110A4865|nr:hypothetical protein [Pseudoalteromonas phenolica]TMN88362.1 hypothetical protein CWB72_13025 [Pseudoalteromonas phenolica]